MIFNFCECFGEKASKQADQFVISYFNLSSNFWMHQTTGLGVLVVLLIK